MLTYNHLYDLARRERSHQELQEISADFYDELQQLLASLAELVREQPFSADAESHRMQLINSKKLARQLYEYREQKILSLAQNASRAGTVDVTRLTPSERALHARLVVELGAARAAHGMAEGPRPIVAQPPPAPAPEAAVLVASVDSSEEAAITRIRVLQSVPQFLGRDMEQYGPFVENESVELPGPVAQVLIRRGSAQQE